MMDFYRILVMVKTNKGYKIAVATGINTHGKLISSVPSVMLSACLSAHIHFLFEKQQVPTKTEHRKLRKLPHIYTTTKSRQQLFFYFMPWKHHSVACNRPLILRHNELNILHRQKQSCFKSMWTPYEQYNVRQIHLLFRRLAPNSAV